MSDQVWLLVLAAFLVLVGGVFVAAETAIGRVSRSGVEDLWGDENARAQQLIDVIADRPRYVNVLLFLSTICTITATVIVGYVCVSLLAATPGQSVFWAIVLAIVVMVAVSYIVLGVAARTLGRQHAERIAMAAVRPARLLVAIFSPFTSLLILIGNAVTPGKGYREGPFASQAELREMLDQAEADDLIEDDERQMLHSVFELGDTVAREVMVPRTEMVFIERSTTLRKALSLALRSGFSRIPVVGEGADDIVGVVYLKDIIKRVFDNRESENTQRTDTLMRVPFFVPDSKPVDELLKDMQAARVHLAIVVDEYGGTAGLVTIEDILEEIVGEIVDEYDTAVPEVDELTDGSFRVHSRMHVDDLAELIDEEIDSEEEGVDTALGLMAKRLGRVPIPGARVDVGHWRLTAERGAGRRNRIATLLVERNDEPDEQ